MVKFTTSKVRQREEAEKQNLFLPPCYGTEADLFADGERVATLVKFGADTTYFLSEVSDEVSDEVSHILFAAFTGEAVQRNFPDIPDHCTYETVLSEIPKRLREYQRI